MESQPDEVLFTIGPYQVSKCLGKGGMGEVFLAYDPRCRRNVALKRMRVELETDPNIRARFLYEAHLTGLMSHPSIVPIYDIVDEPGFTYYTMSYIEGIPLHELLSIGRQQEKEGLPPDARTALPTLLYAFLSICHAISYAHSKGVIHRDLKPANIMLCANGEGVILDWGLAKIMKYEEREVEIEKAADKITGTIGYVAPEQAWGQKADYSTEIYALGIILYEILTLRHPFHRENLEQYRRNITFEVLLDPAKVAPQRSISPILSKIALKCLSSVPQERYPSIEELLFDLENYLKGHAHWFNIGEIDTQHWKRTTDHPLTKKLQTLSSHQAGSLLISDKPFADILKITLNVHLGSSSGIGFLVGISDAECPHGYCLWLASAALKTSRFFYLPEHEIPMQELYLSEKDWHEIQIEKIENIFHFYLDHKLQFTYVQHIPLHDTHVGIWLPGNEMEIKDSQISIGGYTFNANPLAAANAFLAHGHFSEALADYRQVAQQRPYTFEGRKALFRAGVTLLEDHVRTGKPPLELCLQEFQKLSEPVSAPMALLGQAVVCQRTHQYAEEVHCFECAFKRFAHHSMIDLWNTQLLSRLLESSQLDRAILYRFLLLAMRYLPEEAITTPHLHHLLNSKRLSAPLYFLNDQRAADWPVPLWRLSKSLRLAFWLALPDVLSESIDEQLKSPEQHFHSIANALSALLELGAYERVEQKLEAIYEVMLDVQAMAHFEWIHESLLIHRQKEASLSQNLQSILPRVLNKQSMRFITHILYEALRRQQTALVYKNIDLIEKNFTLPKESQHILTGCRIWAFLLDKQWELAADALLHEGDQLEREFSSLSPIFLRGCWIAAVQGETAARHYYVDHSFALDELFIEFIQKKELTPGFLWEKRQFFRQAALYAHCLGDNQAAKDFQNQEKQEYIQ